MGRATRTGSNLDALMSLLRRLAAARMPLPTTDKMADMLCMPGAWEVTKNLTRARERGLITIEHGKACILSISAADGSWRLVGAMVSRQQQAPATKRCLRCRGEFTPPHRGRFLCGPCCAYAENAA